MEESRKKRKAPRLFQVDETPVPTDAEQLQELARAQQERLVFLAQTLDPLTVSSSEFWREVRKCQDLLTAMISVHAYSQAIIATTRPDQ